MKKIFSVEWPDTAGQVWINSDAIIEGLEALFASSKLCSVPIKIEDVTETVSDYYNVEKDHSAFLEKLLRTLYGDGWEKLTLFDAKKCVVQKKPEQNGGHHG